MFTHSLVTLLLTLTLSATSSPLPPLSSSPLQSLSDAGISPNGLSPTSRLALPLAKRLNSTGSANVVKFDQARAKATRLRSQSGDSASPMMAGNYAVGQAFNVAATSQAVSYVTEVLIGDPPTAYQLLVDTGSSNTWVGAGKAFVPSSTTRPTGDLVSVTYGSGMFSGFEVIETIILANGLTLTNQSIGVAQMSEGFEGVDGILGIGPQNLTAGSYALSPNKTTETPTDSAWSMGLLDKYEIGISFQPTQEMNQKNGELTFGGVDRNKFNGALSYVPLTSTLPAAVFVGIDQEISYGSQTIILETTSGIVDTGTTLILLAANAFNAYLALTGGVLDKITGLVLITAAQYGNLKSLFFTIGDATFELTPNAQIWPRALNAQIGGTADGIYLIVADLQNESGQGLDFINGMSFLERFYAVYDIANSRVGLATTQYTYADTN